MAGASEKALAYKTVEIFSGIMGRKLYLKDGPVPKTNGWVIEVPMTDRDMYTLVEHEISHPLFGSDPTAKVLFVNDYSEKVSLVARKRGVDLDRRALRVALDLFVGILEDERVISLWGLLYRGSERLMRERASRDTAKQIPFAHEHLISLFLTIAGGHDPGEGKLSRFEPYFREALRKVHLRDFTATLITAKWLVTQLVSEMIRQSRGEPPPGTSDMPMGAGPGALPGLDAAEGGSEAPQGPDAPAMPWEDQGASESPSEAPDDDGPGGHGQEAWQPPEVKAGVEERTQALQSMVDQLGAVPRNLRERFDDFEESKYTNKWAEREAQRSVKRAMDVPVKNAGQLERKLEQSRGKMQEIIHRVRTAIANVEVQDDRIRRDAFAKVTFTDIRPEDIDTQVVIDPRDEETIKRLRAMFFRVMGRRKAVLDFQGSAIDIPAYIERRMTHTALPVFKTDGSGRGFKALVLIDRSSSMRGQRTKQAERACRIVSRALDFPFVETHVWGFQGLQRNEVGITRFEKGVEVFNTPKSRVKGFTPLHIAMRVAANFLREGNEVKQLIVISDGFPTHLSTRGVSATKALMNFVRAEVVRARRQGINVTGVMIGSDTSVGVRSEVHPDKMRRMFGASKHWRLMGGRNLNQGLVQLVSQSFVDYLRSA